MITLGEAILRLRGDSSQLDRDLDNAEGQTQGFLGRVTSSLGTLAGGAVLGGITAVAGAVVGIGVAALDTASQTQEATRQIQNQFGLTQEEARALAEQARDIFGAGYGESVTDAAASLATVREQMRGLNDAELPAATEAALKLAETFDTDVGTAAGAAQTLMEQFGLTSEQAFNFIAKGYQEGLNKSGDFLETITEYSTQFASGGASADQFFNVMDSGLASGVLGTDKAADAFKEFRVRIQDGSQATADSLAMLGINAEELGAQMASGQVTAAEAFQLVIGRLQETEDTTIRMQAGVGLIGTQFEDLGTEGALALSMVGTRMEDMAGAVAAINIKSNSLGEVLDRVWRSFAVALEPAGAKILELANAVMPVIEEAMIRFGGVIASTVNTSLDWLANTAIPAIRAGWESWGPVLGQIYEFVTGLINTVMSMATPGGIVAAMGLTDEQREVVVRLLAAFLQLRDKLGELANAAVGWVNEKLAFVFDWIQKNTPLIQQTFDKVIGAVRDRIFVDLKAIADFWQNHGDAVMAIVENALTAVRIVFDTALANLLDLVKLGMQLINADWDGAWRTLQDMALRAWDAIKALASLGLNNFWNVLKELWPGITTWWDGSLAGLITLVEGLAGDLYNAGAGVVANLRKGIEAKWGELVAWFAGKLTELRNKLPFSEPKDPSSPLRGLTTSGEAITEGLAEGVDEGGGLLAGAVNETLGEAAEETKKPEATDPFKQWVDSIFGAPGGVIVASVREAMPWFNEIVSFYAQDAIDGLNNHATGKFKAWIDSIIGAPDGVIVASVREAIPWFCEIISFFVADGAEIFKRDMTTRFSEGVHAGLTTSIGIVEAFAASFQAGGTMLARAIGAGLITEFHKWETEFRSRLQSLRDLMPGSEPKDKSSPLSNLADAGAAIVENMRAGLQAAGGLTVPPLQISPALAGAVQMQREQQSVPQRTSNTFNIAPASIAVGSGVSKEQVETLYNSAMRYFFENLQKVSRHKGQDY